MKPLIAAVAACLLLNCTAAAQTRTRRSTPQRRTAPTRNAPSRLDQTKLNAVRIQLSDLNKDLTRFLYLYGRLSKDLELTGSQTESADVTDRTKAGLLESVRGMRDRLDQLEAQFRFTSGLERQYRALEGVSRSADQAAQLVSANRFDQAGRALLDIATRLTDALADM